MVTERGLHSRRPQDWEWRWQGGEVVLIWTPVRAITHTLGVIRQGVLKPLLSCTKESQECCWERASLCVVTLPVTQRSACPCVLRTTMPNQKVLSLRYGNSFLQGSLCSKSLPNVSVCQGQEVASYTVGLGGLCAQPWKSHTWLLLCLAGHPLSHLHMNFHFQSH